MNTQLGHPLLNLHSYAHFYLSVLVVHGQLFEMYARQVRTIIKATLHHVGMAHHKYLNRASMVAHYMRAHNQWLHMACQRVEEAYLASFCKVSRRFWGNYDRTIRDWCHKSCAEARKGKQSLLARFVAASFHHHLANQAAGLETLTGH